MSRKGREAAGRDWLVDKGLVQVYARLRVDTIVH